MSTGSQSIILIPDADVHQHYEDLANRSIMSGRTLLDQYLKLMPLVRLPVPNLAQFLAVLAMWCDVDPGYVETLQEMLHRHFPQSGDAALRFEDAAAIRLARGLLSLYQQNPEAAIRDLDLVYRAQSALRFPDQAVVAAYAMSRGFRDIGKSDFGRCWCEEALDLSKKQPNREKQQVVISLMKAWFLLQSSDKEERNGEALDEALEILRTGIGTLEQTTDDYITLGNIHSMIARRWRRQGNYRDAMDRYREKALPNFERAVTEHGILHPNYLRALAGAGFCARLVALREEANQSSRRLAREKAAFLRAIHHESQILAVRTPQLHGELARLISARMAALGRQEGDLHKSEKAVADMRREASKLLKKAAELHTSAQPGRDMSLIYRAYLHIDEGQLGSACVAATAAQREAGSNNPLLLIRALVVLCVIENRMADEVVPADRGAHLVSAEDFARKALALADKLTHPGLTAKAQTWLGITLAAWDDQKPGARNEALALYKKAEATLDRAHRGDYLWEDLLLLSRELFNANTGDNELGAWLAGIRPLTLEELQRFIVAKVSEKHGNDVKAIAAELGIAREAVVRILSKPPRSRRNNERKVIFPDGPDSEDQVPSPDE